MKSACGLANGLEVEAEFFCRLPRFSILLEEEGEENNDFLLWGAKSDGPSRCGFWDRRPCMHYLEEMEGRRRDRDERNVHTSNQILDLT